MHAYLDYGPPIRNVFIPSNRIAPSTQHIIQKVNVLTTRTANQGFKVKLFAEAIRTDPEIWTADSNFIRPCTIKTIQSTRYNHVVNIGRNTKPLIRAFGQNNSKKH